MSLHLFISGPADGKIVDVDPNRAIINIPILADLKCRFEDGAPRPVSFEEARYERMEFRGNKTSFFIYVLCETSPDAALNLLIKGYVGKQK